MMRYATLQELKQRTAHVAGRGLYAKAARSLDQKTLFFSHAKADLEETEGVIDLLEEHGASVYVDALDRSLPDQPSPKTADILRSAIKACPRFVLFLTPRTEDSRWIPWELGIADGVQGGTHIALFPSSDTSGLAWAQREYLGLYRRIVWANFENKAPEWLVYDHVSNTADRLAHWINPLHGIFG